MLIKMNDLHRKLKKTDKNFGCAAKVIFKSGAIALYRNVTEIHFNYPSACLEVMGQQVAFESDIHQTGQTLRISDISSFETTLETKKEENF